MKWNEVETEPDTTMTQQPESSAGGDERAPSRIRTLLIEDNPNDARLIELMLARADANVELEHVDMLARGLERLNEGGVDVVLADLSLPDSEGLHTFQELHARAPHVPIIVLSGLNDATVAVTAVHEGAQDYLVKGQVDGQLLARAIRYAIERERMSVQLHRYAKELREKNAQLEADFNMAREIQQIFLPGQYPVFPPGAAPDESIVRFAHRYISAAAVGGDFFDIFAINDTTAGVFICDVMGHGMRAALITAIMRGLIEELLPAAAGAGKFMSEINRSLRAILPQTRDLFLATAFYAVVDAAKGEVRFANAGHPSPLRLQREGALVEPLKNYDPRHGPALGLFERAVFPTSRVPLAPGDRILLFTDGIYEVPNAIGEEFGQERFRQSVRRNMGLSLGRLLDELLSDVRKFSGGREFDDDVCLVGVELAAPR